MAKPKCNYCGAVCGPSLGNRFFVRAMTLGVIGETKNPYAPYCSRDCRVDHQVELRRNNAAKLKQVKDDQHVVKQQSQDKIKDKAQAFRELVVGRDVISWEGACADCGDVLIHPEAGLSLIHI